MILTTAARRVTYRLVLSCGGCGRSITLEGRHQGGGKVSCVHCDHANGYVLAPPFAREIPT